MKKVLLRFQSKPWTRRVENILDLIASAHTYLRDIHRLMDSCDRANNDAEFLAKHKELSHAQRAYRETVKSLDKAFGRYRWRSAISGDLVGIRQELKWDSASNDNDSNWEYGAVHFLLEELKHPGAINRFRRCRECRQWFYAATNHQNFCKDTCRRRNASRNPEFREKRRIYMREKYRPLQKQLEQQSIAKAKKHTRG